MILLCSQGGVLPRILALAESAQLLLLPLLLLHDMPILVCATGAT